MSNYNVYIKMPSYLRQWFINRHSGEQPLHLNAGSIEAKLLNIALVKQPDDTPIRTQQPDEVAIALPFSKSRDPRYYNFLTETGKRAMLENIKNSFDVDCWTFLHPFGYIGKKSQKDLIYLFMEQRGIHEDGTCWDAIAKNYQRLRRNSASRDCHRNKNLHMKAPIKKLIKNVSY